MTRPLPEPWAVPVREWEHTRRAAGEAETTIAKRGRHLATLAAEHPDPWAVTAADLAAWVRAQPWAPGTAADYRATLRGFYGWAAGVGYCADNPAQYLTRIAATAVLARPLGERGPLPMPVPPAWEDALRLWRRDLRAVGRSEQTIRLRLAHLCTFARAVAQLPPYAVTFYDLVDWMATRPQWKPETRHAYRTSLRTFYRWAVEAGHMAASPAEKLPATRRGEPDPHPASEDAVRFAVASAEPRERLMVLLAAEAGLRRAEVARVHTRDVVQTNGGPSLVVHGKGAKRRVIPLPPALAAELRGLEEGYAFPNGKGRHLTPDYIAHRVAALLPEGVTMHALRHRFATRAYALDRDVFAVQRLLGHSSPETTLRYVETGEEQLRATVDRLAATTTRAPRQAVSA